MTTATTQGASLTTSSHLGFSLLPEDTSTCGRGEAWIELAYFRGLTSLPLSHGCCAHFRHFKTMDVSATSLKSLLTEGHYFLGSGNIISLFQIIHKLLLPGVSTTCKPRGLHCAKRFLSRTHVDNFPNVDL